MTTGNTLEREEQWRQSWHAPSLCGWPDHTCQCGTLNMVIGHSQHVSGSCCTAGWRTLSLLSEGRVARVQPCFSRHTCAVGARPSQAQEDDHQTVPNADNDQACDQSCDLFLNITRNSTLTPASIRCRLLVECPLIDHSRHPGIRRLAITCQRDGDAGVPKCALGGVAALEEQHGVDVLEDEHQRGRDERQRRRLQPQDVRCRSQHQDRVSRLVLRLTAV